jgi:polyisoprenoid-binding protein YceI
MSFIRFLTAGLVCFGVQWANAESVEVTVKLSPVGSYVAKTNSIEGNVVVEGGKVKASNIKVAAKTLKTGIELRDKHTLERIEADKHPEIVLVTGEGADGKGKGTIKIKGIEKPISGTYKVDGNTLKAQFKISLKEFGIEKVRYLGVGVKDEVEIKVQVPVKK